MVPHPKGGRGDQKEMGKHPRQHHVLSLGPLLLPDVEVPSLMRVLSVLGGSYFLVLADRSLILLRYILRRSLSNLICLASSFSLVLISVLVDIWPTPVPSLALFPSVVDRGRCTISVRRGQDTKRRKDLAFKRMPWRASLARTKAGSRRPRLGRLASLRLSSCHAR